MFTLRPSSSKDVQRNFEIWRSAVLATHGFLSGRDFHEISTLVETSYLPAAALVVAVDEADVPHGFMGTTEDTVDALFVHAESRGKGIGRLLLQSFFANRKQVMLDVNEENSSGRMFYEKMGFQVAGRSDLDDAGRPYPLLHMRWRRS
ncbi:acetyltransferase [Sinorhizobium meliloti]|uniref:acetyltransferase n=1 Tax=Rhizobium meliloti TaxID=382 RepID=UPI000FE0AB35|nr:acetyltransferase [Sinorhizobium meliloti]RVL90337.1 acetyltransferase [Sinorhizobium meliloti]